MKKKILSIALGLMVLLSGCAQTGNTFTESTSTNSSVQTGSLEQADNASTEITSMTVPDQIGASPQQVETKSVSNMDKQIDFSKIQGKITQIYPAGNSKVMIFADKIYLYDIASGETVGTASDEGLDMVRCWTLDSGYVITGTGDLFHVVFYDASLKSRSEFELSKVMDNEKVFMMETNGIDFSSDGNYIVCGSNKGIYLYDRKQNKRTKLIDLTVEDKKAYSGLCDVEQVAFTNDDTTIAFKGQSFSVPVISGDNSFDTIGTINVDGTGLTNQKIDGYAAKELTVYDSCVLVAEDFTTADGRIMIIDNKSSNKKIYPLSDNKEGGNIYGSDSGHYFASSDENETGFTVRIYDAETGKLVKEEKISADGEYIVKDPIMRVVDEIKMCFVILGNRQDTVDTKIVTFAF